MCSDAADRERSRADALTLRSLDPATGEVVGEVPVTAIEDISRLVEGAREAQREWRATASVERVRRIERAGERLAERADELGELLTREMGKPLREARGEVLGCGRGSGEAARSVVAALEPDVLEDERFRSTIHHDPFGVCAAITPWNFPLAMPHWLVLPALAAGNAVLLKPSEETPLIGQAYVDIFCEELPEDVLQVVQGGDEQGRALVAADIDLIAFTGSRAAGRSILAAAAPGLKRVILELGGKDPMIVLADADLDAAARFAVHNSFRNAGQVCVSTERIYADARIAEGLERRMVELAAELRVGNGLDEATDVGPLIHGDQRDHVLAQIDEARRAGARVVRGGEHADGNFLQPTILADIPSSAAILREETFGPVACLCTFQDEEEAVRQANGSPYGLGAVVFGDLAHATEIARRLDAGMIGVNKGCGGVSGAPWVGAKQSGYGYHGSRDGHRQFTQARVVTVPKVVEEQ